MQLLEDERGRRVEWTDGRVDGGYSNSQLHYRYPTYVQRMKITKKCVNVRNMRTINPLTNISFISFYFSEWPKRCVPTNDDDDGNKVSILICHASTVYRHKQLPHFCIHCCRPVHSHISTKIRLGMRKRSETIWGEIDGIDVWNCWNG